MNGRYALDTNVVIALLAEEASVMERIEAVTDVFVPSIVMGELYYGAQKSSRAKENSARLDAFVADNVILNCTIEVARRYGEVKDRLRQAGRPIPENDIWVAALALEHNLTLVTRDEHFAAVIGLTVEAWKQ